MRAIAASDCGRGPFEEWGEPMFRGVVRAASMAAVIALLSAGAALADAGGQGTVTITEHAHNVTLFSDPVTNPCTGEPGTLTAIAANEVFHVTFFTVSDEFWVTGTDEGTVTFTPDDPSGVSASGHFAAWFGESFNGSILDASTRVCLKARAFALACTVFADLEGTRYERGFDHRRDPAFAARAALDFGDQGCARVRA